MPAYRLYDLLLPVSRGPLLLVGGMVLAGLLTMPSLLRADDWPMWRGLTSNGISEETELIDRWDPRGGPQSHLLWKSEKLAGRSTPIVLRGRLYVMVRDQPGMETEGEKVVCADAATGEIFWEHRLNVYQANVPVSRVGWSSVVGDLETGHVYTLGACGHFCCLNGETGKVVWERSLHEELGLQSASEEGTDSGTSFPVLFEDTILVSGVLTGWGNTPKWGLMATPAHRFMSFDKATGELRWISGTRLNPYDTTYSTPVLATLAGQRAIVFGSGDGAVWAMQPGTGKRLWKYQLSRHGLNVSPVVDADGHVYTGHSRENLAGDSPGAFVAIDGNQMAQEAASQEPRDLTETPLWKKEEAMVGRSSPLVIDGRVYAVTDTATLLIIDAKTGEEIAQKSLGSHMRGSLLHAEGKIYACTRGGRWWVLRSTNEGIEVVHQLTLLGEQVDASPIVSDGRVYLTTSRAMYCLANPQIEPPVPSEAVPATPRKLHDKRIAQAHLVPCDAILSPGEKRQYRVRLYNEAGEFIREAKPEKVSFGVAGPGKMTAAGVYKAPSKAGHQVVLVLCEVAGISAEARLRIVPPLPWSFDFEGKYPVPLTWIGGRTNYAAKQAKAGDHYLAALIGKRNHLWMGPSTLANYTVQADIQLRKGQATKGVVGEEETVRLPTAGLINSRYSFVLSGPSGEVRLQSWGANNNRTHAAVPMKLKPGVWYRMKLTVIPKPEENVCVVQAKVWRRGKEEPGAWTLELTDKAPNLQGSPGLFSDTRDAAFYIDNLIVTPNE